MDVRDLIEEALTAGGDGLCRGSTGSGTGAQAMREPKVGDWVCYLDGEGTCLGIIEYVTDKGISGIHFGFGLTLADAMADTVMKIWAMMNPTKETR